MVSKQRDFVVVFFTKNVEEAVQVIVVGKDHNNKVVKHMCAIGELVSLRDYGVGRGMVVSVNTSNSVQPDVARNDREENFTQGNDETVDFLPQV